MELRFLDLQILCLAFLKELRELDGRLLDGLMILVIIFKKDGTNISKI